MPLGVRVLALESQTFQNSRFCLGALAYNQGMAEEKPPAPNPEHLARFRRVVTAIVAVPKDVLTIQLEEEMGEPRKMVRLSANDGSNV